MNENARSIVVGLVVGLIVIGALNWWTSRSKVPRSQTNASVVTIKPAEKGKNVKESAVDAFPKVSRENPGKLLAKVGEGGVWQNEFQWAVVRFSQEYPEYASLPPEEKRRKALDKAIDEEILFQVAIRQGALRQPKIRERILTHYRADYVMKRVDPKNFTEEEVDAYLEKNKSRLMEPPVLQGAVFYFNRAANGEEIERRRQEALTRPESLEFAKRPGVDSWIEFRDFRTGADSTAISEEDRKMILSLKPGEVSPVVDMGLTKAIFWIREVRAPQSVKRPHAVHELLLEKNKSLMAEWESRFPTEDAQFEEALRNRTHYDRMIYNQIVNDFVRQMMNHPRNLDGEKMKMAKEGVADRVRSQVSVEIHGF